MPLERGLVTQHPLLTLPCVVCVRVCVKETDCLQSVCLIHPPDSPDSSFTPLHFQLDNPLEANAITYHISLYGDGKRKISMRLAAHMDDVNRITSEF